MCKSIAFSSLDECLGSKEVQEGDVRVYKEGTSPPGFYVPPKDDPVRGMHLDQVTRHFQRHKAAG